MKLEYELFTQIRINRIGKTDTKIQPMNSPLRCIMVTSEGGIDNGYTKPIVNNDDIII